MEYINFLEKRVEEFRVELLNLALKKFGLIVRHCADSRTSQDQRNYAIQLMHSLNGTIEQANVLVTEFNGKIQKARINFKTEEEIKSESDMIFNEAQAKFIQLKFDINAVVIPIHE